MGYIKKLKNNELVGGTDKTTIYPVTSTEAVFEEITNGNESSFKSQKTINKEQQDELDDHEERIQAAEAEDIKSITINGSTKKFEVDDENNVDLTIYTVDNDPEMPSIASNVEDLRNMVGTSTPVLETSHKTRIETLEGGESVTGSVENKIKTKVDSINSSYQDDDNEYVKYSMTQTSGEVTDFNIDETNLKNAIASLNTSISGDNIVIRSGSTPSGTGEAGKIYRYVNSSNNTYTDYMYSGGSWVPLATHDTSNEQAQVAYYTCTASGSGAQATKQFVGNGSLTYTPSSGGHIKILMGEANTATGTIYLQFGTTTSTKKPLYYNGESVSSDNTWEAGETIAVYYDPSANNNAGAYFASNAQGGGGKAEKIKYDNSQSKLVATDVQGALDIVGEEIISYAPVYDDDKFSFSTTSSTKSAYYLRAIPFVQGGIYRLTFTLDDVKENDVELYLANSSNRSATGLARIGIGRIKAGSNTITIDYICNDATMLYPSINCAVATSGSLSILVEKQSYISTEMNDVQESVKSLYITKDVEVNASDGFEIAGYNISPTTWKSETPRKIQRIPVTDCDSVTITALSTEGRNTSYSFITKGYYGTSTPVYYCKGYTGWVTVPYGETITVDVPELAEYIIIYKDYGGTVFFPAKLVFHKRVNPTEDISDAIDFAENAVDKRIDGAGYSVGSYTIDNASPSKWADSSIGAKSRIVPLKAGRYTLRADNGIGIYAILKSANRIHGEAPDWADDFRGRLRLNYGQSTTIELSADSYLWCRHDSEAPNPAGNEMLTIIPEVSNTEFLQEQLASYNKPLSTIIVAASDSTSYDKARADIVCTGTDDNKSIETAISMIGGSKGTVYLCRGTYYVTSFTEDTDGTFVGIRIPGKDSSLKVVNIEGYHWGGASYQDVRIVIDQTTYDSLDDEKSYSIIRHAYVSNGYNLNYRLALRHIGFTIYSNQKKITVIDCSCTSQIVTEDINGSVTTQPGVWGAGDEGLDPIPSLDCVFFRGLIASGNAWSKLKDTYCSGYGIGMGIQGEHLISESCGAINCFYGFAFNYFDNYRANGSMNVHPMMVINPIEEGCLNYPYFGDNPQKQSIIIQGYHNEHRPKFFNQGGNYATEKTPGQWYGHVDYVIQNFPDSHSHGSEMHAVEIPFWAAGSGVNMESVNMVHKRIATSAIRRGYAPNYAQQIFDTTANKLLICTDPANGTWVDVNGNVVQ